MKTLASFPVVALMWAAGCGVAATRALPPRADRLLGNNTAASSLQDEALWQAFAKELGLKYEAPASNDASPADNPRKTEDDLESELNTYPTLVSDDRIAETTSLLMDGFLGQSTNSENSPTPSSTNSDPGRPFFGSRCARVESVEPVSAIQPIDPNTGQALEDVQAFKIQYVLEDRTRARALALTGEEPSIGDKVLRSALLIVPKETAEGAKLPLALYGHGGDKGLSYTEIAEFFGSHQRSMIIAAPSFPEEPICAGETSVASPTCRGGRATTVADPTPAGTLKPLDSDADELLGLQHCLARTLLTYHPDTRIKAFGFSDSGPESGSFALNDLLAHRLQLHGDAEGPSSTVSSALLEAEPRTILFGASRGAAASLIALAKTGAAHDARAELTNTTSLTHISCAALLFPPTTFAMGRLRIGLELFVKGLARSSVFYSLPLASALADFFADYRKGNLTAQEMARRYMLIDPLFGAGLVASALRDWRLGSDTNDALAAGRLLMMHGRLDRVVGGENTLFYARRLAQVSQNLSRQGKAPGTRIAALSFQPKPSDPFPTGNVVAALFYQHGDAVFRRSLSTPDGSLGPWVSSYLRKPQDLSWNLLQDPQGGPSFEGELMSRQGATPQQALDQWLSTSCPLQP